MSTLVHEQQKQKGGIRRFDLGAAILISLTLGFSLGSSWETSRVVDVFHRKYYDAKIYNNTYWLGTPIQKVPSDLWVYQEILWQNRPDVILEMGTFKGGSARYLASICDLTGHGRIITVDIMELPNRPAHPRITYLLGSSTSDAIVQQVRGLVRPGETVMVVLDSDHRRDHVLREMKTYGPMVTPGQYMLVEDTNINGHPVLPWWGDPGPFAAVAEFMKGNRDFVQDKSREKFLVTFNPGGWLKKIP